MRRHMPTNARKVSNREIRRQHLRALEEHDGIIREGAKTFSILLTVLAQKGGEIVVTKGTIEQVGENLKHLSYTIVAGANPNEFIVRMLEGEGTDHAQAEPSEEAQPQVVMRRISETEDSDSPASDSTQRTGDEVV